MMNGMMDWNELASQHITFFATDTFALISELHIFLALDLIWGPVREGKMCVMIVIVRQH